MWNLNSEFKFENESFVELFENSNIYDESSKETEFVSADVTSSWPFTKI